MTNRPPMVTIPATTGGDRRYAVESATSVLSAEADDHGQRWTLTAWRRAHNRGYAAQLTGAGQTSTSGDHGTYTGTGPITTAALIDAWPDATAPPDDLLATCRRYDMSQGAWTQNEDAVIAQHYLDGGADACMHKLPGRSRNAIQHRASALSATRTKDSSNTLWTEAEDSIVREHYPTRGGSAIQGLLPGRSAKAIRLRAAILGIRYLARI